MTQALQWIVFSNPVALWWGFLVSVSIINILFWMWTLIFFRKSAPDIHNLVVYASGFYVFGCAFRSVLPRADVQRIVLFDSWLSSVLVGRSVATLAELAFVFQWALILNLVARIVDSKKVHMISFLIVPIIFIAECFSWYAVVTTNYLGNTIEESLWTLTYTLIGLSLLILLPKLKGPLKFAGFVAILGVSIYVGFMSFVDVPMYLDRWQLDLANGKEFFGLLDGFHDLATRWIVTHEISDWKEEIPWMSLYFSAAVWTSLALCYIPLSKDRLSKYLKAKIAVEEVET